MNCSVFVGDKTLPTNCYVLQNLTIERCRKREGLLHVAGPTKRNGALAGTRTPNLLIRSQMLYPLSYQCNGI